MGAGSTSCYGEAGLAGRASASLCFPVPFCKEGGSSAHLASPLPSYGLSAPLAVGSGASRALLLPGVHSAASLHVFDARTFSGLGPAGTFLMATGFGRWLHLSPHTWGLFFHPPALPPLTDPCVSVGSHSKTLWCARIPAPHLPALPALLLPPARAFHRPGLRCSGQLC